MVKLLFGRFITNRGRTSLQLVSVMERSSQLFHEGEYLVRYEEVNSPKDALDYSNMAMVISLEAKLTNHEKVIGGLRLLQKKLSSYDYCAVIERGNGAYNVGTFWVVEPSNPEELLELQSIFKKFGAVFVFSDGSGSLSLSNIRSGRGVTNSRMV